MTRWFSGAIIVVILLVVGFFVLNAYIYNAKQGEEEVKAPTQNSNVYKTGNMKIQSSAFNNNSSIPSKYTCDGGGVNPPLSFSEIPENAKSLVLIMEDPDVPKNLKPDGMFDHWIIFNMPADTSSIPEDSTPPGIVGKSSSGGNAYVGACPPDREHRYFFKLYALDGNLELDKNANKSSLESAMQGHVVEQAELIGLYIRSQKS
jgi:Raf kinase inhibitor-like YbhB/YbcL family protein